MAAAQQFCTFYLDGLFFGVEVEKVQEVIRHQTMTRVPLAPRLIGGLINLRGQIVTAIDLRLRVGLPERGPEALPMNVVVRSDDGAVSLLVDEIGDVVEVSDDSFESPPDTLQGQGRELVRGVYKLKDRLLHALQLERTIRIDDARVPGESRKLGPEAGLPGTRVRTDFRVATTARKSEEGLDRSGRRQLRSGGNVA
jgi:purine-binding chemotaxis protein CheW